MNELQNPYLVFSVFEYLVFIVCFFIYFPFPQFYRAYSAHCHRKYLASVNERFMREWKLREQSK